MASLPPPEDHRVLVKHIQSNNYLINKQMQHICALNGMRTQGVKAELQRRIIDGTWAYLLEFNVSRVDCHYLHSPPTSSKTPSPRDPLGPSSNPIIPILQSKSNIPRLPPLQRVPALRLLPRPVARQMGLLFSKPMSNFPSYTALNKAYSDADSRTYREIEQSIYREKQTARGGGHSASQTQDSRSPSLPTPTNHAQSTMNNMTNNYGYQPPNGHQGYSGYGSMNGHRSQPVPPHGMS